MASPKFNTKSPTIRRILREAQELSSAPSPDYTATPLESDLFEWHFTLRGPPNSPYAQGLYHGRIVLPPTYPLRPPSFRFTTPSGRFEANREICLSISGHHEETWQPAWGLRTALVALRSFMETDAKGQLGGIDSTDAVRRRLATESRAWRCAACGGRTNAEVMRACEEEAAAADDGDEKEKKPRPDEVVPSELRMGFRDEMEAAAARDSASKDSAEDAESAELAEGFVQTVPRAQPPAPQPGATALQPTRTIPLAPANDHPQAAVAIPVQTAQMHRQSSNDAVPLWVDRAIVILAVLLIAMLFKMLIS